MAQQGKGLAATPDGLNLIPRTHIVKGENCQVLVAHNINPSKMRENISMI